MNNYDSFEYYAINVYPDLKLSIGFEIISITKNILILIGSSKEILSLTNPRSCMCKVNTDVIVNNTALTKVDFEISLYLIFIISKLFKGMFCLRLNKST